MTPDLWLVSLPGAITALGALVVSILAWWSTKKREERQDNRQDKNDAFANLNTLLTTQQQVINDLRTAALEGDKAMREMQMQMMRLTMQNAQKGETPPEAKLLLKFTEPSQAIQRLEKSQKESVE